MGAGSIFMVVVSPPLIAISIICSCKRQLKIFPSIGTEKAERTDVDTSLSRNDETLSVVPSITSDISNGNYEKSISDNNVIGNEICKKNEIVNVIPEIPDIQSQEMIQKLSDKQAWKNMKKEEAEQQNIRIKDMPELLNDIPTSLLQQFISSDVSFANENDHLLSKKNDLQETRNEKSNFSHLEEHMKQPIAGDRNDIEQEISALIVNDIIIFPSQLKWKLINTVQQVKIQNPTENRFAIKAKCTDNDLYRIKPVFTFVEPKSSVVFDVNRNDGIATVDHILFLTTLAEKTDDDPRVLFADTMGNNNNIIKMVKTIPFQIK